MFEKFASVQIARERGRRRNERRAELISVGAFEIESVAALRGVQSARAAERNFFKVFGQAGVQRVDKNRERIQIHAPKAVMRKSLGVRIRLIGIAIFIAVGRMIWNVNFSFGVRNIGANLQRLVGARGAGQAAVVFRSGDRSFSAEKRLESDRTDGGGRHGGAFDASKKFS